MKKFKLITLLSGLIAGGLTVSSVFAMWAVTDNAKPNAIRISLANPDSTVYMKPGAWGNDNAWFACYCFGNADKDSVWVKGISCEDVNYYSFNIPSGYPSIVFARRSSDSVDIFDWEKDHVWNQSVDITLKDSIDLYTFSTWDQGVDQKSTFSESKHSCINGTPREENRVPATCEVDGSYDIVTHCSICNKVLNSEPVVIDATGHDYSCDYDWVADNECKATAICSHDSTHKHEETAIAEITESIPATCTSKGSITYTASYNNILFVQQTNTIEVEMADHTPDLTSWANDSTYHWNVCSVCKTGEYNKAEHTFVNGVCSTCGYDKNCYHTNLVEHKAVQATCTTPGNGLYYSCPDCGLYFSDDDCTIQIEANSWIINAKGHSYSSDYSWNATNTSCTGTATCSACGDIQTEVSTTISESVTKDPTCTATGTKTLTATFTNSLFTTQTKIGVSISALGHNYGSDHYCTRCGELDPNYVKIEITAKDCNTAYGENVFIYGIGGWDDAHRIALSCSNGDWVGSFVVAKSSTALEYKLVKVNGSSSSWEREGTSNRSLTPSSSTSLTIHWNWWYE